MSYNETLCERLDLNKLLSRELVDSFIKKYAIEDVEEREVTKKIKNLPKEIQKKIYIYALKFFYREDFKNKPLFSIHNRYVGLITKMKKEVLVDNVHFLHLDCNTLPENKKYILGCQCDYCKSCPRSLKDKIYDDLMRKPSNGLGVSSFLKTIDGSGIGNIAGFCNCVFNPNDFYDYEYKSYLEGYNFVKDAYYSPLKEDPLESPLYFSSSVVDIYKI